MREEQTKLQALQTLDSVILDVKEELSGLSRNIAELESRLKEKQAQIDEKLKQIKELENQRTDLEKMLFIEQERLKKTRNRLQGAGKQHPYAYAANQKEMEKIKKDIEVIENNLLKKMQDIEDQRAIPEKFKTELADLHQQHADAVTFGESQTRELKVKQGELEAERKTLTAEIDSKTLAIYERILVRYPRNAVVIAQDEFCLGCHMHIPPQLFNELQRGEKLITCPTCSRLLLFGPFVENEINKKAASG